MIKAIKHYFYHRYIQKKLLLHRVYSWTCHCGMIIGHPQAGEVVRCDDNCPICKHLKL